MRTGERLRSWSGRFLKVNYLLFNDYTGIHLHDYLCAVLLDETMTVAKKYNAKLERRTKCWRLLTLF